MRAELAANCDVLIVGAGPAGAGAARALGRSGLRTLIVERHSLPRFKMCSGILFPSARRFIAEHFGQIPEKALCRPRLVRGNRIHMSFEAPSFDAPFALFDGEECLEKEGLNSSRSELDHWLCSESDAELVGDCRFEGFEAEDRGYRVELRHAGKPAIVRTRFLIGADGTLSKLRQTAFPGFDQGVGLLPNYEEFYEGEVDLEPGWLHLFMDRRVTGYFATVFHDEGRIQVVTGVRQPESIRDCFDAFRAHLEASHGLRVREKVESHGIVLTDMSARRNYCLGARDLLLVGEAGGFLRGGEGITSALCSGRAAGRAVLRSIETGAPAIEPFREFAREELEICEQVHERLTQALGFNVFRRPLLAEMSAGAEP